MSRRSRVLLGIWVVLNAGVIATLVLDPQVVKMVECAQPTTTFGNSFDNLFPCPSPARPRDFVESKHLLAGAILGNGIILAVWIARKPHLNASA